MADSIVLKGLTDEDIYFTNFTGISGPFNKEGDRNFGIFIDEDTADDLEKRGFNVKTVKKPESPHFGRLYIKVLVRPNWRPTPKIYLLTKKNTILMDEESLEDFDNYIFDRVDIKITRVYLKRYDQWTQILEKGFFTLLEDELDYMYPEASSNAIRGKRVQSVDRFTPVEEDENPFM